MPKLLEVVGSVIGAGNGRNNEKSMLDWLLPNVWKFLNNDDWRVIKAGAETMVRTAMAEEEFAHLYKKTCVGILESRRFDKVKLVRETMNRTLGLRKQHEDDSTEVLESSSSSRTTSSGKRSNTMKGIDKNSNVSMMLMRKIAKSSRVEREAEPINVRS